MATWSRNCVQKPNETSWPHVESILVCVSAVESCILQMCCAVLVMLLGVVDVAIVGECVGQCAGRTKFFFSVEWPMDAAARMSLATWVVVPKEAQRL